LLLCTGSIHLAPLSGTLDSRIFSKDYAENYSKLLTLTIAVKKTMCVCCVYRESTTIPGLAETGRTTTYFCRVYVRI